MKKFFLLIIVALMMHPGIDAQENFLSAHKSLSTSVPINGYYGAIDVNNDLLVALAGDTVFSISLDNASVVSKTSVSDSTYSGFEAFLTVDPTSKDIWVGYTTSGNVDDRIYKYDCDLNEWTHIATFPNNFDLALRNGKAFVSGLNSTSFDAPNGIWLLDESGRNEHRMLINIGGYSAGLDIDSDGNVYYATSFFSDNALQKWSSANIASVLANEDDTLNIASAEILANLPAGAYDIDLDSVNNIIFNSNNFIENFIGKWDGHSSYDTLATSDQYITHLASYGDLSLKQPGSKVYAMAYGYYISEVQYLLHSSSSHLIQNNKISVYPNPIQDHFLIETDHKGSAHLTLTDMSGRRVFLEEYWNPDEPVDVSFLIPGNYVLTYWSKGLIYKAIVQKK